MESSSTGQLRDGRDTGAAVHVEDGDQPEGLP
jgi:hypothetical protein